MEQKDIDLYEDYEHGVLDRREFLARLADIAGGTALAYSLLPLLENDYARGQIVPAHDSRITPAHVTYPGATGDIRAYLVSPEGQEKVPGVIVIHEIWGLNAHIEDVARRLAVEGFTAIAPDALSPLGGSPEDPAKARPMFAHLDTRSTVKNYAAALQYLRTLPRSNGKTGVIGFCWGGGMANRLAVHSRELTAAVPFYGMQPASEDVPAIRASLLLHYAGDDERINKGIPAFEDAMKKASTDYRLHMYEGAKHAFHNDTNEARYDREAAQLAWKRTIAFLNEKLKT